VAVKTAGTLTPATDALMVTVPTVAPRVTVIWACPLAPVTALALLSVALPPVTAKLTERPGTKLPLASLTCTTKGLGSAVPTAAV
jgi:hypothetical protein